MSNMSLEDIKEALRVTQSEEEFLLLFEITVEDLVERFSDLIEENQEELPFLLGMDKTVEDYEDRE